ncbi:MAG: hypothetical protein ACFFDI_21260 [Promethearchaeota archaeon]
MKNKLFKVMALVALVFVVVGLIVSLSSPLKAGGGTCCPEWGSLCIVEGYVFEHYYYKPSGPCNEPPQY